MVEDNNSPSICPLYPEAVRRLTNERVSGQPIPCTEASILEPRCEEGMDSQPPIAHNRVALPSYCCQPFNYLRMSLEDLAEPIKYGE